MGFKFLFILIISVITSACNVAEQTPQKDLNSQNSTSNNSIGFDQQIFFSGIQTNVTEGSGSKSINIYRSGKDILPNQIVKIKLAGTADVSDITSIIVDGNTIPVVGGEFDLPFVGTDLNQTITVYFTVDDTIYEGEETLRFEIQESVAGEYTFKNPSAFTFLIADNETLPIINFTTPAINMSEGMAYPSSIQVQIDRPSSKDISVPVFIKNTSTADGADHNFVDQIAIIPAGALSVTLPISINNNDSTAENNELLTLQLLSPSGAVLSAVDTEMDITILDAGATFNLSIDTPTIAENGGSANLTLTLTQALDSNLEVPIIITSGGGNITETDYQISSHKFEIAAGATTSTIVVNSLDDNLFEDDEIITFSVANAYNAIVGTSSVNLTITDAEVAPVISFQYSTLTTQEDPNGVEDQIVYVPITVTPAADEEIVLNYSVNVSSTATATADYELPAAGTITVSAGQSIVQLPINIKKDTIFDPNETIILDLSLASGPGAVSGLNATQITIKEPNSLPIISLTSAAQNTSEGSSANLDFTISNTIENPLNVQLDISNSSALINDDFDAAFTTTGSCSYNSGTQVLTFSASSTSCQLTIPIIADAIYEFAEDFKVSMRQPQSASLGTINSHTISIINTNPKPNLKVSLDDSSDYLTGTTIADNTVEGTTDQINFYLEEASGVDTVINYSITGTATNNSDYVKTTTGQAIIYAGDLSYSFNLNIMNDGVFEITNDTIVTSILPGTTYNVGAQSSSTITITEVTTIPKLQIVNATAFTTNPLLVNENDIVNINFKLEAPVEQDIRVYYTVQDDNDAAYCGTLNALTHKCAIIASDSTELETLTSGAYEGFITIPQGQTLATLSFKIDVDHLFELDLLERLKINIDANSIRATDGTTPLETVVAEFDAAYNYMEVDIDDIDVSPVAFFATPKFKTVSENIGDFKAKVNLSSAAEVPVTYHVQIIQYAEAGKNKADENDFDDLTTNGNITGSTYSNDDLHPALPATTYAALTYVNASNIIYEGLFTIPAYADSADIELPILNDPLYEGTEQFQIKIVDDPAESTYNWQVNFSHDTFLASLSETTSAPSVSFDAGIPANITEGNETPATIQAANTPAAVSALGTTDVNFTFNLTSVSQHIDLSFDISVAGTAMNTHDVFATKSLYMKGDYYVIHPITGIQIGNATDYTGSYTSATNTFTVSVPAGSQYTSDHFTSFIAQDYKYEPDTTKNIITAQIQNATNIIIGAANNHSLTIDDDDAVPFINFAETVPATSKEYDANILKLYATDDSLTFSADEMTEEDITVSSFVNATLRSGPVAPSAPINLSLTSATNYTLPYGSSSTILNVDPRTVANFVFEISAVTNAQILTTNAYYNATGPLSGNPALTSTINLNYDDLKAALSKDSEKLTVVGEFKVYSHTCTYYRGLVSCFGNNRSGQLGRGISAESYGSLPGETIDNQADIINLGTDSMGYQNYAKQLALGKNHSCALLASNKIVCWGRNTYGQLGRGDAATIGLTPSQMGNNLIAVDLGLTSEVPVSIHAMNESTCAVLDDGTAKCWGRNNLGQLGIESTTTIGITSTQMGTNLQKVMISSSELITQMSTGANHACVYLNGTSNKIRCWGDNSKGQLGLNSALESVGKATGEMGSTTVYIDDISDISEIELGLNHTCVRFDPTVKTSYNTRCWGDNYYGQLGLGRLTRAGMYVKAAELSEYSAPGDACNYGKTIALNGNNCTSMIGKDQGDTSGDYISIEEIEGDGIATTNNDILLKPSDNDSGDNAVDVGVANNQFTQLYHPTYDLATGESYSCGVVHDTSDVTISEAITVRCWGSNYIFNGPDTDSSNQFDLGVLNNNGHSYFYNPSTDAYGGFMWSAVNSSCYTGTPGSEYNSSVCDFVNHFKVIGDDFSEYYRINYYYWILGGSNDIYENGFTSRFPGTLDTIPGINHEMHANSQSKFNFGSLFGTLDDIKIYGGAHHVCSVPIVNGVTSGDNNQMRCWGANHVGQAGINWVEGAGCDPDIVGGLWSCGPGNGETRTFNYSF